MLITLALYHRDTISRGNSRRIFSYEAYHWSLVLLPAPSSTTGTTTTTTYSFDATDASDIDPVTFRLRNPTMDWWLRAETDPPANPKLIGQLVVGALPASETDFAQLRSLFEAVPLPVKNTHPQQSCVTWAVAAIGAMQARGWVPAFDLSAFKDAALAYADARMGEDTTEPAVKDYNP
ncbi:hypothetical protein PWT90_02088 [Aphanocladium album]|nr:hypothetical protein PWT90_02088 [Aphanocladium album]